MDGWLCGHSWPVLRSVLRCIWGEFLNQCFINRVSYKFSAEPERCVDCGPTILYNFKYAGLPGVGHAKVHIKCNYNVKATRFKQQIHICFLQLIFQLSGPEIAFLYPDFSTALYGQFENGVLVKAKEARLSNIGKLLFTH